MPDDPQAPQPAPPADQPLAPDQSSQEMSSRGGNKNHDNPQQTQIGTVGQPQASAPEKTQNQPSSAESNQAAGEPAAKPVASSDSATPTVSEPHIVPAESVMVDVSPDPAISAMQTETTQDPSPQPSQDNEIVLRPESPEVPSDQNKADQIDSYPEEESEPHIVPAESVMVDVPPDPVEPSAAPEGTVGTSDSPDDLSPIADPGIDATPLDNQSLQGDESDRGKLENPEATQKPIQPPRRSQLPVILIAVVGLIAVAAGWYALSSGLLSRTPTQEVTVVEPTPVPESTPVPSKQYQSEFHGVSFSYPPHYTVSGSLAPDEATYITSPEDYQLIITDPASPAKPTVIIEARWQTVEPEPVTGVLEVNSTYDTLIFRNVPKEVSPSATLAEEGDDLQEDTVVYRSELVTINNIPFVFTMSHLARGNTVLEYELMSILNSIQIPQVQWQTAQLPGLDSTFVVPPYTGVTPQESGSLKLTISGPQQGEESGFYDGIIMYVKVEDGIASLEELRQDNIEADLDDYYQLSNYSQTTVAGKSGISYVTLDTREDQPETPRPLNHVYLQLDSQTIVSIIYHIFDYDGQSQAEYATISNLVIESIAKTDN